jgi:hypothetical protein
MQQAGNKLQISVLHAFLKVSHQKSPFTRTGCKDNKFPVFFVPGPEFTVMECPLL